MKIINSINMALKLFEESAILHGFSTLSGDYKQCNKHYECIMGCIEYLYNNKEVDTLKPFLDNKNTSVRMWAAYALLPLYTNKCKSVLAEISFQQNILGFTAETTLQEWEKGKLKIHPEES